MRRVIAVCGILVVLFALGAFAQGYAEGYEDGKAAAMKTVISGDFMSFIGNKLTPVPTELMEGIKDMPESYQEGYVMGYKDNAEIAAIQSSSTWIVNFGIYFVLLMVLIGVILGGLVAVLP